MPMKMHETQPNANMPIAAFRFNDLQFRQGGVVFGSDISGRSTRLRDEARHGWDDRPRCSLASPFLFIDAAPWRTHPRNLRAVLVSDRPLARSVAPHPFLPGCGAFRRRRLRT